MIVSDGYSIQDYPNEIRISLPQTLRACTTTTREVQDRKDRLSDMELSIILGVVKNIYQGLYGE